MYFIGNGRKPNRPLLISLSLIFLFFAFRVGFTPDYEGYFDQFESKGDYFGNSGRHSSELLYLLTLRHIPFRFALIIQTAVFCVALYYTFKAVPYKYWWFCILLLFFIRAFLLGNMGAFRSSFVTALLLLAIKSRELYGQKIGSIIGVILISISALIHKSGWVIVPIYILLGAQPFAAYKKNIWIFGSLVFVFLSYFFAGWMNDVFNNAFQDNEDLETYLRTDIEDGVILGTFTLLRIVMLLFLLFYTLKNTSKRDYSIMEMNCVKFTVVFLLITIMPDIALKDRFCYYFSLLAVIGATTIIKSDKTMMRYVYTGAWILYAFWDFYLFMNKPNFIIFYMHYNNILFDSI